ncbi:MAG: 1-acyl-sn-glycerol-3-phosphate acyltransferase [Clostridia bacterium]|nr:1-acyl-sn-glycerol-3-phosphate acyltransferase [Clostridia bacterium]
MNKFFSTIKFILRPIIKFFYRAKCYGAENVPQSGAVIIAANHLHALDPFFISEFVNRDMRFMGKEELIRLPLIGRLFKKAGMIPVNRTMVSRECIDEALKALDEGYAFCIFPQGTRRRGKDPRKTPIKNGVGMFAYYSKAPVVPVLIESKNMRTRLFRKTIVRFGKPITYDELNFEKGSVSEFHDSSEMIFQRICDMGSFAEKERANENNNS